MMVERIDPERLADRIKASGLSHTRLAKEAGLHQPAISRLLKGQQYGTARLYELARVLGTTPDYLEGKVDDPDEGADTGQRLSSDEAEWVEMYAGLTPEQRKAIRALVKTMVGEVPTGTLINDKRQEYGVPGQG